MVFSACFLLYALFVSAREDGLHGEVPLYWQLAPLALLAYLHVEALLSNHHLLRLGEILFSLGLALALYFLWYLSLWGGADVKQAWIFLLWLGPWWTLVSLTLACLLTLPVFYWQRREGRRKDLPLLPFWNSVVYVLVCFFV